MSKKTRPHRGAPASRPGSGQATGRPAPRQQGPEETEADAGDHTFFIADVLSIEHGPSHHALVYRESTYHSV